MIRVFADAKHSDWISKFVKTESEDAVQAHISETSYLKKLKMQNLVVAQFLNMLMFLVYYGC